MSKSCKRILSWLMVLCMVLPLFPAADAARVTWRESDQTITAQLSDHQVKENTAEVRDDSEMVRVSIVLEDPSTVEAGYATVGIGANAEAMAYRADLKAVQKRMEKTISAKALNGRPLDVVWNMTLVGNIISAWVPYGSIEEIAAIPGVKTVAMEAKYEPCAAQVVEGVTPNTYASSGMIGSSSLWNSGYTGAGTRIAVVDTGVDTAHQSFDNGAYLYAMAQNAAAKGMTTEKYMASLDLLTAEKIAKVLPDMNLSQLDPDVCAEDLYLNEKLAFGYNYVDANLRINHLNDYQGEHGSHVSGISTANRYIPNGRGGYSAAADSVMMQGVAPDAQLITMKVFGEESPFDSDYMAAIEDAILLDCDVVNLSLGTTAPGEPYTKVYSELMEMMTHTDTVVVISAGNASNWAAASLFGYSYSDDVVFDTVGSPGSYGSAFTVASVENDGTVGFYFEAEGQKAFYVENMGFGNTNFCHLDTSLDLDGTEYEYIFLDGLGYPEEYNGINVTGKVVMVSRGTLNFAEKANNALSRGAVGVVVYNNQPGVSNMDLSGLAYEAPVVSITQAEGAAIRAASENKGNYLTGKLTVYGKMGMGSKNSEYYTMSTFSSWGVPGNLSLKPEITAPGGNIYSVWGTNAANGGGTDQYETMSGTSMAAPQVAGMSALMAQYYKENGMAEKSGLSPRHLAQSLLMSTAEPLREEAAGGNYYSLLNQGAGLARVDLASQAESYILVEGQPDAKVKAELGDDPERTGVYAFDFTITNMTDSEKVYELDADVFRQDVFEYQPDSDVWLLDTWTTDLAADVTFTTAESSGPAFACDLNGDGKTSAADADYLLENLVGNDAELKADADLSGDGSITSYDAHLLLAKLGTASDGTPVNSIAVPANETVTIGVEIALTEEGKAELDAENPNGAYVEAYVYARGVADDEGNLGTVHSIPVLAFYGDWSDPSMFDRGTLIEHMHLAINTAPYLYRFIGTYGNALGIDYGDGSGEYYYGGNPIAQDAAYLPQRNAFNSEDDSVITEQGFTLIRSAGAARVQVTNAKTGEVYLEKLLGELYPTYYNSSIGTWENTIQYAKLNWSGTDASGKPLPEGTQVNITLTAATHYERKADGSYDFDGLGAGSSLTTSMTIDNTLPQVLDMDLSQLDADKLTITAKDNEYVAAVALLNGNGSKLLDADTPNQTEKNTEVAVELDLTGVYGNSFLVAVYDYARNVNVYEVELNLGSPERDYFTAIDYQTMNYVSVDMEGQTSVIAETGLPVLARAAEYVGGYVFLITDDNSLCVASDEDLTITERICQMDPLGSLLITGFSDMAYNPVDGKLYAQFYSQYNYEEYPFLCTIDMGDGAIEVICELPEDVNTMAIDSDGNFYSMGFASTSLYTYTLADVTGVEPSMRYIGDTGYYYSNQLSSMAWDHNAGELYWTFPNTLLRIDTETAEPTILGYHEGLLVGLYTRPEENEGRFDPIDEADRVELNVTDTRVMLDATLQLEATVWPWYASDRTVTWTSSDESIATVSANGLVTGLKEGKCVITATSNLDPTLKAECAIEVFRMEKTLNALVWDEAGEIWMSEFSTAKLPEYTKISETSLGYDLASATIDEDGTIYAASLNVNTLKSDLYTLDSTTFKPTKIGPSTDGYVDLAPAPGQGEDRLMAVYGGNILNVDATTGDYYNHYYMFAYNLVGLAYVGTEPYTDWGYNTTVDWYFVIDRLGNVYLLGFLEQDGQYFYIEHDALAPGGLYTQLPFEMDTGYFGSAYFDGEFLYFSAYKESRDNVTLMAVDVAGGSKSCYTLGTFEDGVWPVAGLMELDGVGNHIAIIHSTDDSIETMSQPKLVEKAELKGIREEQAQGTLNSAAAPMSAGEIKNNLVYVDVTLPQSGTNAIQTIEYDSAMLELQEVDGRTAAFAWKNTGSSVTIAAAEAEPISEEAVVARLVFRPISWGETTIRIATSELSDASVNMAQNITVTLPGGPAEVATGWSGNTTWVLTEDGVLTFSGEGNMKNYGYDGGQPWLDYADQIRSVVLEEGVAAVGTGAFMNLTKLESVTLPASSLTRIGEAAFYGCSSLTQIDIPDTVYTVFDYTFKNCTALADVRLSRELIKVGEGAFENCTALDYIYIPGYTEIIGAWSFKGCTALEEADMSWTDATEIREGAFKNCTSLTTIELPGELRILGDSCFYGIGAKRFTVPATVTTVADWCFARASLTEIKFEGDAPAIGEGAFNKIALTAYYPGGNASWTSDVMQNYGGTVTWTAN